MQHTESDMKCSLRTHVIPSAQPVNLLMITEIVTPAAPHKSVMQVRHHVMTAPRTHIPVLTTVPAYLATQASPSPVEMQPAHLVAMMASSTTKLRTFVQIVRQGRLARLEARHATNAQRIPRLVPGLVRVQAVLLGLVRLLLVILRLLLCPYITNARSAICRVLRHVLRP